LSSLQFFLLLLLHYEHLNKQKFADSAVIIHNLLSNVAKVEESSRIHPALKMAALFINTKEEDTTVYNEEVIRLPRNSDVTNVYLVADNCTETVNGSLTQVQPGEENFYVNDPDMKSYLFFVQKGKRIDTYNVPPCIKEIEVERAFMEDELDVPLDVAYNILVQILGITLKVRGFVPVEDNSSDGNRNQLRYQLEQQEKKSL